MKQIPTSTLLALALFLVACGGGGGGKDEEQDNTLVDTTSVSTADLDGHIAYNNQGDVATLGAQGVPQVGDNGDVPGGPTATVHEGVWSFDLTQIPPGTTIGAATLRLVIVSAVNDPDAMMALGRLDHVQYGATFPISRALINVLEFDFAQIADMTSTGERFVDVTAQVQADLDSGRARSQFRLRGAIPSDGDDIAEFATLSSGETSNPALRPTLLVQFTQP